MIIDTDKITADSKFIVALADLFKEWCCEFHRPEDCGDVTCEMCFNAVIHDTLRCSRDELTYNPPATIQWISVKDRMPDKKKLGEKYLVYMPKYGEVTIGKYIHHYYGFGFYSICSEDEHGYPLYIDEKVTHWAYLPKEPEPEINNDK